MNVVLVSSYIRKKEALGLVFRRKKENRALESRSDIRERHKG
jgi:hypothetical protein